MTRARLACVAFALSSFARAASAETLIVPGDFTTIQAAIDAAEPADVVLVEPGTYTENVELVPNVDLRGRETARTLLAPEDDSAPTVSIAGASAVRVSNLTLIDSTTGVAVNGSSGIEIANVVFDGTTDIGLISDAFSGVTVSNNVFFENGTAVSRGSASTVVESNIFRRNATSIATFAQPGIDQFANVLSNCFSGNEDMQNGDAELGVGATVGDPLFVDPAKRDFHLREGSPCIDAGRGTDVIDDTAADAGAYGGPFADALPFPVGAPTLTDASDSGAGAFAVGVTWPANLDYRVTSSVSPGGYFLLYEQGGDAAPPFDGTDAGGGTMPSPIDVGDSTSFTLEDLEPMAAAPLAPRLRSAAGRNEAAVLTWEPVADATGYRIYYGVDDVIENVETVGAVTTATVTGLENGTRHRFAVAAVNQPRYHVAITVYDNTQNRNESEPSEASTLEVGDVLESPLSGELTATPAATQPYPSLPDEGCFIATAAFGADWAAEVRVLREFRDRYLLTHAAGRRLVRLYYAYGPHGAAYLNEHEALKPVVRATLLPWVGLALVLLEAPLAAAAFCAATLAAAVAAARRRRRARARGRAQGAGKARRGGCGRPGAAARSPSVPAAAVAVAAAVAAAVLAGAAPPAAAQDAEPPLSPRWMYELKGGYYYPDLDRYSLFYGDDRDTFAAVAGSWRARDWLEIGAEIGYLRDKGVGERSGTGDPGGEVTLRLYPAQVFASFIWQPRPERRFVPYGGIGVAGAWYEQDVELEPSRDGRSDIGAALRAGLRFMFASEGPRTRAPRSRETTYWRSYVFVEAQRLDVDVDGIDLGGDSYQLGFRVEFELGR